MKLKINIKIKKWVPLLIILGVSITAWMFELQHYFNVETIRVHQKAFENHITNHYFLSILIYSISYISVVVLSLPIASFMSILGGFLFGQWIGVCMVVTAATLGGCLFFLSARMASSDLLKKKTEGFSAKMQKGFQENALSYLLTLRLIPIFPFVVVNLAAALFQVSFRTYFVATFFGIIPGSFVYVSMGVALREVIQKPGFSPSFILEPKLLVAFIGLGVLSLLPVIYKSLKKNR